MISHFKIEHYKSIESLDIDCNRINILIGEPNTGKSNILEALALFTYIDQAFTSSRSDLSSYIRFKDLSNLFTDGLIDRNVNIEVNLQDIKRTITLPEIAKGKINDTIEKISIVSEPDSYILSDHVKINEEFQDKRSFTFDFFGKSRGGSGSQVSSSEIKFYNYREFPEYNDLTTKSLTPPFGENLVALIQAHKPLRKKVSEILKSEGYRLLIKPHSKQIEIIKDIDEVSFGYPYTILSDTLKRVIFYTLAIQSNQHATIVLEEPESCTFPYYTKHLAEMIALDDLNQYFIATHNPYLLRSIIEKAPKEMVNIFVVSIKDYLTRVSKIDSKKIPELLDSDPFFNLESFIEE
jgi:AAA15 family ATPase/GTPase